LPHGRWQSAGTSQPATQGRSQTSQTSESHQYDANGNRTTTGTTTGGNNRLLSDDRYDYQYDAEGNRTRRTERATGKYEVLAWDHRNRLTSVTTFSVTGTKLAAAEYTYDVFDRRIARRVDADGNGVFETTQRFVYDGEDLILAFTGCQRAPQNRPVPRRRPAGLRRRGCEPQPVCGEWGDVVGGSEWDGDE
jgi:hypothetical protein